MKYHSTFFGFFILMFLFACIQSNSKKNETQTDKQTSDNQVLTIDTFSTFPPEINGCSCYFSNDSTDFKKGKYIYMTDFDKTSFLKVNGIITKFIQTEFKEMNKSRTMIKIKSDQYEMTIEMLDGIQNGDETWLKTGTIQLKDKNGTTITKTFYGECGC